MTPDDGRWTPSIQSPPVAESDIRRWAIATYWPERPPPLYWDASYAAATRWGGIIAPRDFNPFAWPIEAPQKVFASRPESFPEHPHIMNGGQRDRYGEPIRPGDVISSRNRLAGVQTRPTRLGETHFISTEYEWINQTGRLVRFRTSTLIRY